MDTDAPLRGNCTDPPDPDDALPYWLLDEQYQCRAIDCLPECPAYDYGCRIRADSVAGDDLRARLKKAEQDREEMRGLLLHATTCRDQMDGDADNCTDCPAQDGCQATWGKVWAALARASTEEVSCPE